MKQQRLDAPVFEFWYLVGDDLGQHLGEFHTEGFIHKGVETDLEKTLDHLEDGHPRGTETGRSVRILEIFNLIIIIDKYNSSYKHFEI